MKSTPQNRDERTHPASRDNESPISRRDFLKASAATAILAAASPLALASPGGKRMGVSIASYGQRSRAGGRFPDLPDFRDPSNILNHCHSHGAGGVQIGIRGWETAFARRVRDHREKLGMYLEGQISLPRTEGDVAKFESDTRQAKEAGATILRTVMLGSRRYETFKTWDAWLDHRKRTWNSLTWVEPILRRHGMKLAIENHKDWRVPDLLDIMKRISSEAVGITIDTGNSIALLEDPYEVIEAYAPFAMTTHFKDMGVAEYADGFLLAEVPLGEGFLDLRRIKDICEKANPAVQFNLEMITRDALEIPCLTERYWVTFPQLEGKYLARTLSMVREHTCKDALPSVTGLSDRERITYEDENVAKSFAYARQHLGL